MMESVIMGAVVVAAAAGGGGRKGHSLARKISKKEKEIDDLGNEL